MRSARLSLAALIGVTCAGALGCELIVGGYEVETSGDAPGGAGGGGAAPGGAGGGGAGGDAHCAGLPVLRSWSFEGGDALDGLEPRGTLGGEAEAGRLVFDYAGKAPGPGGRVFDFPPGTARASACARARWDDVFPSQTLLLTALELTWTGGEYCGFFLSVTSVGAIQLFAIATVDGDQVALADVQGGVVPAAGWHDLELLVDPVSGEVTGRIGESTVALAYAAEGFDQCPGDPALARLTVGSALSAPGAVRLELDHLRVGRSIN